MVEHDMEFYRRKAELCKTLADPKRLIILNELRDGEISVGSLAKKVGIGQAVVSRQLAILRQKGVVETRREGTNIYYRLADLKLIKACDLVQEVLLGQIKKSRRLADRLVNE
jgi:DNA-binding transcriptional ArsR family regulator